jgi:hypothetical protein
MDGTSLEPLAICMHGAVTEKYFDGEEETYFVRGTLARSKNCDHEMKWAERSS